MVFEPQYNELCQWLWSRLLQRELKSFMDFRNGARVRKIKEKPGPSGMSRDYAFSVPESWGGRNCLLQVDVAVVRQMKEALGGEALLEFVSPEFAARACSVYESLKISELRFENAWDVFAAMRPLMVAS